MRPGLVSLTLRDTAPREVARLAAVAGLEGVEWSSAHLPCGEEKAAGEIAAVTAGHGLAVAAYGSSCRLGEEGEAATFAAVVDTAAALGAPLVRVWAGRRGSAEADEAYRARVVADSLDIAGRAARAGITVAYEYHARTLTDSRDSTARLLREAAHPNLRTLWQPPRRDSEEEILAGLADVRDHLANLHVFHWRYGPTGPAERRPLAEGRERWLRYLRTAGPAPGSGNRYALLEFVRDDDPEALRRDAGTLRGWLAESAAEEAAR